MQRSLFTFTIGMLTAFGPFITDFYLPALPLMSADLHVSEALVQFSLTTSMIGLAAGQLILGPLSDRYGRLPVLHVSLLLFIASSAACALVGNIHVFNTARFVQGLGGAGGLVLSKGISADLYTGDKLTRFMGVLGMINAIVSLAAPIIGGLLLNVMDWHSVFYGCTLIGVLLFALSLRLKETLPEARRLSASPIKALGNLFVVMRNVRFSLGTVALMLSFFLFFSLISSSTFVLQSTYGLTPTAYSLVFGGGLLAIGLGAMLSSRICSRRQALVLGTLMQLGGAVLTAVALLIVGNAWAVSTAYILTLLAFGIVQTVLTTLCMDAERQRAGSAGAVVGAASFLAGALAPPLATLGSADLGSSLCMVVSAIAATSCTLLMCRL